MRVITIKAKYETTVSAFDFALNDRRTFTVVAISFCMDIKIVMLKIVYRKNPANVVPSIEF